MFFTRVKRHCIPNINLKPDGRRTRTNNEIRWNLSTDKNTEWVISFLHQYTGYHKEDDFDPERVMAEFVHCENKHEDQCMSSIMGLHHDDMNYDIFPYGCISLRIYLHNTFSLVPTLIARHNEKTIAYYNDTLEFPDDYPIYIIPGYTKHIDATLHGVGVCEYIHFSIGLKSMYIPDGIPCSNLREEDHEDLTEQEKNIRQRITGLYVDGETVHYLHE